MAIESQNFQQMVTTMSFLNRVCVQGGMGGYVAGKHIGFVMALFSVMTKQEKNPYKVLKDYAWAGFAIGTLVKLLQKPTVEKEGQTKSTDYPAKLLMIYLIGKIVIEGGCAYYQLGKQLDKVIKVNDSYWRFKLIFCGLGVLYKATEVYESDLYKQFLQKWHDEAAERTKKEETHKTAEINRQKAEEEARQPYRDEEEISFRKEIQASERSAQLKLYQEYLAWQSRRIVASWDANSTSLESSDSNTTQQENTQNTT